MSMRELIAKALLRGKPGGPHEGGIAAYHSSPYDFDKFDWSKLRTGEGANAYGAGFYAAENPAVSGQGGQYWGQFLNRFGGGERDAANTLRGAGFDREQAASLIRKDIEQAHRILKEGLGQMRPGDPRVAKALEAKELALRQLESGQPIGPRTYEVNIKARPEELLDWDKPLSAQPRFEDFLYERLLDKMPHKKAVDQLDVMQRQTGDQLYRSLGQPLEASQAMRDAGIPGIRYLDQGSRGASKQADELLKIYQTPERVREVAQQAIKSGSGDSDYWQAVLRGLGDRSYNYVVTDPSKLEIMAKYGIVAGAPIGLGAIAQPYDALANEVPR